MNSTKEIDIKDRTYYNFADMINKTSWPKQNQDRWKSHTKIFLFKTLDM